MPEGRGSKSGRVGERGQVSIEKAIRDQLGIHAGDRAVQRVEVGRVVIEFIPAPHRRSLFGPWFTFDREMERHGVDARVP
jgi:AbrB family looped-hinge helix DNA binding protein